MAHLFSSKGRRLRYSPGRGNLRHCAVTLSLGEGLKRDSDTCSALCQFSVTLRATHKQIGPFWCWFPGEWVCIHSRTLWVSLTNFSVRLGVSPTASTPTGVFSQRFEALFPHTGTLGCVVCLAPQCSSWFIHTPMWDCLLRQPPPHPKSSPPRRVSAPPTGLEECFFFNSLVVGLPYSSIFCQFWLVLFLNLLLSFFWLWEEALCVYLFLHLGQKFSFIFLMGFSTVLESQ